MNTQLATGRAPAPCHLTLAIAHAFTLGANGAALAQTAQLPGVDITASPVIEANRTDSFGSLATEVTESQVRELNALDLASALRRTPGVVVSRFNPVGSFGGDEGGAVYVRGLATALARADALLPQERRAKFASFEGMVRMDAGGHHAPHDAAAKR